MNKLNLAVGINGGFLAPVVVLDFEDKKIEEISKLIMQAGGFAMAYWGEEHPDTLREAKAVFKSSETEATQAVVGVLEIGQPVIMVIKQVYDLLDPEEALAMLYHEEGHVFHRDFETKPEEGEIFILQDDMEIRADAYAAAKISKAVMGRALRSLIGSVVGALRATKTVSDEKLLEIEAHAADVSANHPHALKRFAALA